MILPDWFYAGVIEEALVLTIDPAYFRLTGGIERWLYRLVRKHGGRQRRGWQFDFRTCTSSQAASPVLPIFPSTSVASLRQSLPGYRLLIERKGRTELLRILPADPSTVPVNNPVNRLGRSGATVSADQAQTVSAEQAHPPQLNPWAERQSRAANLEV